MSDYVYVYIEFPKWVDGKYGPVVVQDADEQATVLAAAEVV